MEAACVDLDTLATALYVKIDDGLKASPQLNPDRPAVGSYDAARLAHLLRDLPVRVLARMRSEACRNYVTRTPPTGGPG